VNSVLTGMFDLFEAAPSAAAIAAAKASASKTASQEALVLPKANVDQPENSRRKNRILEQIFGGDEGRDQPKRKKKKKKTLFDSIF
jgi:hypothetical protein